MECGGGAGSFDTEVMRSAGGNLMPSDNNVGLNLKHPINQFRVTALVDQLDGCLDPEPLIFRIQTRASAWAKTSSSAAPARPTCTAASAGIPMSQAQRARRGLRFSSINSLKGWAFSRAAG
jgi:hypothetical protein